MSFQTLTLVLSHQVCQRMKESMADAKSTANTGKQKALLQFAKDCAVKANYNN